MSTVRTVAALGLAVCAATTGRGAAAQQPAPPTGSAIGLVADQFAQPVAGAEVMLVGGPAPLVTLTGEAGAYRLDGLAPGAHRLRFRRFGYLPATSTMVAVADALSDRDMVLLKLPFALNPSTVQGLDGELRADFSAYTRRAAVGVGAFIDRAAIDRLRPTTATDLMRALDRFRVVGSAHGGFRLVGAGAPGECAPRFFVDGVPYAPVDGIDDFDPEHIEAVEGYAPNEAPAPLNDAPTPCGAVVVWLRR
jgi:hypothetical protein